MLLTGTASPVTGAPGAVLLYVLIGALAWPPVSPQAGTAGRWRAGRGAWALLWFGAAVLWLSPANRSPNSSMTSSLTAPQASPTGCQAANQSGNHYQRPRAGHRHQRGRGVRRHRPGRAHPFATTIPHRRRSVVHGYVGVGPAFGTVLTGQATDPNAGPLFALLAIALLARPRSPSQCSPPTSPLVVNFADAW
jgi:hypothetical protein